MPQDPEVFDSTNLEIKRFHGTDRAPAEGSGYLRGITDLKTIGTAKIVLSPWQIDTNPDDLDKEAGPVELAVEALGGGLLGPGAVVFKEAMLRSPTTVEITFQAQVEALFTEVSMQGCSV
eukprot:Skav220672  [mRNA]  locus=scaffold1914:229515:231072:+ [translate_table: standard]